jgi:UDP-N-acetyl-D-mannosaminuronate dehydrogenase
LNIALFNELAPTFNRLGVDTQDVLEAAGSKLNFLPFKPGLVGGHCIGVDPFYLTHRAERSGYYSQMILAGRLINDQIGVFVGRRTVQELVRIGKGSVEAKVLVLGLIFKEDCPDLRNSRVPDILEELNAYGCKLYVHDPCCDFDEAREEIGVELANLEVFQLQMQSFWGVPLIHFRE